jgi:nucleoside-diphosphate-sugar epimerase
VGGESVVTILDLAKTIGEKLNKEILTPERETSLDGNPKIVNISIRKYIEEFGKPSFKTLDYGLNNTIKWQKHIYEKNNL